MNETELGAAALAALGAISIVCGLGVLLILRRFSDQAAIARTKNRVVAHLLEFRLFGDEPRLVLRAQWNVVVQSLRLMKLLLLPATIMTVPMLFLFAQLDAVFGRVSLTPGQPGIVTMQLSGEDGAPELEASAGMSVETPAVRAPASRQVSWRIRPNSPGPELLRFAHGDRVITKSVSVGAGLRYVSEKRTRFGFDFPLHATELPLEGGNIEWIEVGYGHAVIQGFHWLVWFLLISGATVLLLRKRFGVAA